MRTTIKKILKEEALAVYIFGALIPIAADTSIMGMAVLLLFLEQIVRWSPLRKDYIKSRISWKNPAVWLFLLYLMHVVALAYSKNTGFGTMDLGMKASFALLPVFFICYNIKVNWKRFLQFFILGIFLSIFINVYLDWEGIQKFFESHLFYWISGARFSLLMHRGYWAVYLSIGIFALIKWCVDTPKRRYFLLLINILGVVFILGAILLSGSRMGLIIVALIIAWSIAKMVIQLKKIWIAGTSVILVVFVVYLGLQLNMPITRRFKGLINDAFKPIEQVNTENPGNGMARRMTWNSSLSLIKENFWLGVGSGDIKDELIKRDFEKGYDSIAEAHLNCHNQFLNTQLAVGIFGTICFIMIFLTSCMAIKGEAIREWRIVIISILFLAMMTESMLENQQGIIPYSFFISLMVIPGIYLSKVRSS